jgi:tetratricopeptide (TPR) repeat protein
MIFLVVVPFVLYFRVIYFDFTSYDDTQIISNNYSLIKNLENFPKAFTTDSFLSSKNSFYRPLQSLSFMIDAQFSQEKPWAYHLTNIILHILSVILLFLFLKQIKIQDKIAFLLALIFSVHPMLTNAVCWIPARGDLFLTLFSLLSFITFIRYFSNKKNKYLLYHSICFLLLGFSKENAIVFPLLAIIYFYLILKKDNSYKELIPFVVIWCCSFIICYILRQNAIKVSEPSFTFGMIPFIKNLSVIPIVLGKIIVPQGLTTMPLFNYISIIIGIVVCILFVILIIIAKIRKKGNLIFGLSWFICFTLPPMFFRLPLADHGVEYFEHRSGLPIIGILIVTGVLLNVLLKRMANKKIFIMSLIVLLFAILAWYHSDDYSNSLSFYSKAIKSNPDNVFALNSRAGIYYSNGNLDLSIKDLNNSIRICPTFSSLYFNRGNIYNQMKDENQAIYYYSQALKYDTLYPEINYPPSDYVYVKLSVLKVNLNKYDEALELLKKAATIDPGDSKIYNNIGNIYLTKTRYDSAIQAYSKGIELEPNSETLFNNRGRAKYTIKDYISALTDLNKAIELNPEYPDAYFYRGITKSEMGNNEEAISDFNMAIGLDFQFGEAYYYRGAAYSKLNKPDEAQKDWAIARNLGYKTTYIEK